MRAILRAFVIAVLAAIRHLQRRRKLFITARNDANSSGLRLPGIRAQYARAQTPKEFTLVEGSAHGQNILSTPEGAAVLRDIIRFVKGR